MKSINQCRFCGHHLLAHLHWVNEPEFNWIEGKCSQENYTCLCTEYGDKDNLTYLEEKYDKKHSL